MSTLSETGNALLAHAAGAGEGLREPISEAVADLCEKAMAHGWLEDEGSPSGAKAAKAEYEDARTRLTALCAELQAENGRLVAQLKENASILLENSKIMDEAANHLRLRQLEAAPPVSDELRRFAREISVPNPSPFYITEFRAMAAVFVLDLIAKEDRARLAQTGGRDGQ